MKRRALFLLAVFFATAAMMAVQKLLFLAWHASRAGGAGPGEWLLTVWHGLKLDMTVAGYVTAPVLLLTLLSLWVNLSDRIWRRIFIVWFAAVSVVTAAVVAVDIELYTYWGFRIDGTILIYLSDPKEAAASLGVWQTVRQLLLCAAIAAAMLWVYVRIVHELFDSRRLRGRLLATLGMLLLGGLCFLAIRGGTTVAVANISKVYFSDRMFLNHAATNPLFSLFSTLGDNEDYASAYPFFPEEERAARFEALRGNAPGCGEPAVQVLRTQRPDIVLVILESFARTIMDEEIDGAAVMPNMRRFREEGIWFENFFANSYRTDRGEVAVMNGFPAQTRMSIMKLPAKNRTLPSLARSLAREGYRTSFTYGGDLNFTNQASYMYATGWNRLTWQKGMHFDAPTSKWGYADDVVTEFFAREVIAESGRGGRFLAGLLTLSSHEPFDVPFDRFDDKVLNAMAFTDDCLGRMIDTLKASPAWENLLVVLVADHSYGYPYGIAYNVPLRHRIPMIWLGGAVERPMVVGEYASQIDLCATLLGQMGLDHSDFDYSKDIFGVAPPRKFAYWTFNDGFGVADASGVVVFDCTGGMAVEGDSEELFDIGRTMLQTTYVDIGRR